MKTYIIVKKDKNSQLFEHRSNIQNTDNIHEQSLSYDKHEKLVADTTSEQREISMEVEQIFYTYASTTTLFTIFW